MVKLGRNSASRVTSLRLHVSAPPGPGRHEEHAGRRARGEAGGLRVVDVEHREPVPVERLQQLALDPRHPGAPPSGPAWASPMLVITPTVGRAIAHSAAMSPCARAPISSTSASVAAGAVSRVSGTPASLL